MSAPGLRYAPCCDSIQHISGRRLTREDALRARAYHEGVVSSPSAAEERVSGSHEMIRQIDAALASVWPVPAVASIRTIHSGE